MKCFLFGHKFGKLENNIQYCKRCGIAKRIECDHKWDTIRSCFNESLGIYKRILKCNKCGEEKCLKH